MPTLQIPIHPPPPPYLPPTPSPTYFLLTTAIPFPLNPHTLHHITPSHPIFPIISSSPPPPILPYPTIPIPFNPLSHLPQLAHQSIPAHPPREGPCLLQMSGEGPCLRKGRSLRGTFAKVTYPPS